MIKNWPQIHVLYNGIMYMYIAALLLFNSVFQLHVQ